MNILEFGLWFNKQTNKKTPKPNVHEFISKIVLWHRLSYITHVNLGKTIFIIFAFNKLTPWRHFHSPMYATYTTRHFWAQGNQWVGPFETKLDGTDYSPDVWIQSRLEAKWRIEQTRCSRLPKRRISRGPDLTRHNSCESNEIGCLENTNLKAYFFLPIMDNNFRSSSIRTMKPKIYLSAVCI